MDYIRRLQITIEPETTYVTTPETQIDRPIVSHIRVTMEVNGKKMTYINAFHPDDFTSHFEYYMDTARRMIMDKIRSGQDEG